MNSGESADGVLHPCTQVDAVAPCVFGDRLGTAGGVGVGDGALADVAAGDETLADGETLGAPPVQAAAISPRATIDVEKPCLRDIASPGSIPATGFPWYNLYPHARPGPPPR